jgi:sugar lactone lactonase YvrE
MNIWSFSHVNIYQKKVVRFQIPYGGFSKWRIPKSAAEGGVAREAGRVGGCKLGLLFGAAAGSYSMGI